jgi:hypothetical protein
VNPLIFVIIVQPEVVNLVIRLWPGLREKVVLSVPVRNGDWTGKREGQIIIHDSLNSM